VGSHGVASENSGPMNEGMALDREGHREARI